MAKCSVITDISRELWENNSRLWLAVNFNNWFCSSLILFAADRSGKFWELKSSSDGSKSK